MRRSGCANVYLLWLILVSVTPNHGLPWETLSDLYLILTELGLCKARS